MNLRKDHWHKPQKQTTPRISNSLYACIFQLFENPQVLVLDWTRHFLFLTHTRWTDWRNTLKTKFNEYTFQRWISGFSQRWRTPRNAICNVNCRIKWIIKSLNANGCSEPSRLEHTWSRLVCQTQNALQIEVAGRCARSFTGVSLIASRALELAATACRNPNRCVRVIVNLARVKLVRLCDKLLAPIFNLFT